MIFRVKMCLLYGLVKPIKSTQRTHSWQVLWVTHLSLHIYVFIYTRDIYPFRSTGQFSAGRIEGDGSQWTVMGWNHCHSALRHKRQRKRFIWWGNVEWQEFNISCPVSNSGLNCQKAKNLLCWYFYQIVGVVDNNFADGVTAWVCQERVGMVDGESTQT